MKANTPKKKKCRFQKIDGFALQAFRKRAFGQCRGEKTGNEKEQGHIDPGHETNAAMKCDNQQDTDSLGDIGDFIAFLRRKSFSGFPDIHLRRQCGSIHGNVTGPVTGNMSAIKY